MPTTSSQPVVRSESAREINAIAIFDQRPGGQCSDQQYRQDGLAGSHRDALSNEPSSQHGGPAGPEASGGTDRRTKPIGIFVTSRRPEHETYREPRLRVDADALP